MDIDSSSDSYSMLDDIDIDVIRKRLASSFNYTNSSTSTTNTEDCPAGLRVLVVDDNTSCLFVSSRLLMKFGYEVTGVGSGKEALEKLSEKPGHFDLVVCDLHMPEMNGLQLLRRIKRKYASLPVLLMSGDIKSHMVTRALEQGAGYYLYKPLTYSDIEKLWQHIVKSKVDKKVSDENMEQTRSVCQDSSRGKQKIGRVDISSSSEGSSSNQESRKRKEPTKEQAEVGKRCRARSEASKKPRVVWTAELHNHFLDAIEKLGVDRGVPKRILDYMRVPGLTRENVASHLQKYRIFVKKLVENNRFIEPSTVKSLASRAFHSNFASDEPMPVNIPQNLSQQAPKYSFGSIQSGSEDGHFQGVNTQTHTSHLAASTVAAGFQLGHSSTNPLYSSKGLIASVKQPWPTTSVAAGNASSSNHQNIANIRRENQNAVSIGPSQSHVSVPMGGGRSGRGTMRLVHQQNLMKWKSNVPSSGQLNTAGTGSVFEGLNFQRQNNNEVVGNFGTTGSIGSSFVGNSSQSSTFNSSNFTGLQIINNNTNSPGTLRIGPIVSKPSNDNNINNNMDYGFTNNLNNNMHHGFTNIPTSSVMEVPGLIPEFPAMQSSYSAIEVPNPIPDYLNNQPPSAEPINISNPIPGYSCMTTTGFSTSLQNEASFGGGLILNENHESLAPQQENQLPAAPVAQAPLDLEAQEAEQAAEDAEDPFEGLYDLVRNDPNLGNNSLAPLMEDEDFANFFQDFEQSTADQGRAMYDDEDFLDPDFGMCTGGANNGDDDDIFLL